MKNGIREHYRVNISNIGRLLAGVVTATIFAVACGGGGSSDSAPPPPPQPVAPPPPPPPAALDDPIETVIGAGTVTVDLVDFAQAPGTSDRVTGGFLNNPATRIQYLKQVGNRFFFNDTRGVLWVSEGSGAMPTEYLDLRAQDVGFNADNFPQESGFMGFAFHPDFLSESADGFGKFYTTFSANPDGTADFIEEASSVQESVLMEWSVEDPLAAEFSGEFREVLRVGQFAANHNVGSIAFNPTVASDSDEYGLLYVSFGDGGSAHDPADHGQNPNSILGSIIRIDPLATSGEAAYGIPASNPFADGAEGLPEVWAYGLRHPQHFSWDLEDGRMFILDIGQDQIEEVNLGIAGGNYGWRVREGTFATAYGVSTEERPGGVYERDAGSDEFIYPVAQYDHDEGFAIGSGFVYRGSEIEALSGMFVFTELVRGRLLYIDASTLEAGSPSTISELNVRIEGEEVSLVDVAGHNNTAPGHAPYDQRVDLRLSQDAAGELYVLSKGDGSIRKLMAN